MSEERSDRVDRLVGCKRHDWMDLSEEISRYGRTMFEWCRKCGKLKETSISDGESKWRTKFHTPNRVIYGKLSTYDSDKGEQ